MTKYNRDPSIILDGYSKMLRHQIINPLTVETEGDGVRMSCLEGEVDGRASNSNNAVCSRNDEMVSTILYGVNQI